MKKLFVVIVLLGIMLIVSLWSPEGPRGSVKERRLVNDTMKVFVGGIWNGEWFARDK